MEFIIGGAQCWSCLNNRKCGHHSEIGLFRSDNGLNCFTHMPADTSCILCKKILPTNTKFANVHLDCLQNMKHPCMFCKSVQCTLYYYFNKSWTWACDKCIMDNRK